MFIVKKKIGNEEYYYLRQSKRVDGKVKAITLAYLGKEKKLAKQKAREIEKGLTEKKKDLKETKKPINMKKKSKEETDFLSFIQEAGLVWGPSPEIYGGVSGFYTYGPLGKLLKNKVENSVRKIFNTNGFREIEGPTILPDKVWKASGHLETFEDRIIKCKKCEAIFRADKLIEENQDISADAFSDNKILEFIKKNGINCPSCSGKLENKIEKQSLMMKTLVAGQESSLRPETATVTYLPYPRLYNYFRKKIPFSVYQIGKAYRNEISPRQHVLRGREFTQAEGQLFIDPEEKNNWEKFKRIKKEKLPFWDFQSQNKNKDIQNISLSEAIEKKLIKSEAYAWCLWIAYTQFRNFGIPKERIRIRQHHPDEMAFYANDAWDIELNLNNYSWTEVCGVHDRADYDLKQHGEASGIKLEAIRENGEKFIPHILEIAFGTDRPTYALIDIFYNKKETNEGKTTFKIPYQMAPIDISIFPLMKKPELLKLSQEIKEILEEDFIIDYDISGSIGKRYLRSAKAGTPYAITIDYNSLENQDVTIRDRDSEKQIRIKIEDLKDTIRKLLKKEIEFEKI